MRNESLDIFQEQNSWFDCIGDIDENAIMRKPRTHSKEVPSNYGIQGMKIDQHQIQFETQFDPLKFDLPEKYKRVRNDAEGSDQWNTQNSSSSEIKPMTGVTRQETQKSSKAQYVSKYHIYSKNYRQRKKQRVKLLSEQNDYLKKKIHDLESRVRQMQLQINRLKFTPDQKQSTIDQLNEQFMNKVNFIMQNNKQNNQNYAEYKLKYNPTDPFYGEFMQTYAMHGFAGSKKMEIINYYYNEIIQSLLRDSERYFCLICANSKDAESIEGFPGYEQIKSIFVDILQPDEDKMKRLKHFQVNLYPLVSELVESCKHLNFKFNRIVKAMERIHDFLSTNYLTNFDLARMRIFDLESWFQKNKYTKMMRSMRLQWLQEIKKEDCNEIEQKKNSVGNKKKKVPQKQE